jgi:hypothetical protein
LVLIETPYSHTVDTEHEGGQGRFDGCHIGGSVYDASLQGGSVCDLEQRVDIVEIGLPELEDLDLFWVKGRDIEGCLTRAKQEVVVVLVHLLPGFVDDNLTYTIRRGFAAIVGILRLLLTISGV